MADSVNKGIPLMPPSFPKEELKPCPFCGGEAHLVHGLFEDEFVHSDFPKVACPYCGVSTKIYLRAESAIKAWNRRTENDQRR